MSGADLADRIDEQAGVIRRVKVLGRKSDNGREYTREAVRDAVQRYEGRSVYVDHRIDPNSPRSSRDKFGWFEAVKPDENDELWGDFHYLKSHPMAAPTIEAARRRPQLFGFSHDAVGRAKPGSNDTIIESIDEVNSVDLVGEPATTHGFFESRGNLMTTPAAKNRPKTANGQRTKKTLRTVLTEALHPRTSQKKRAAVRTWLKEMDDYMAPDEPMEGTPGAAGEDLDAEPPAHGHELMQAICDMIEGALENADGSALDSEYKDKLEAIKDICKSHGKDGKGEGEDEEEEETSSQEGKKGGKKPSAAQKELREEMRQLKAENFAIREASAAGISLTATQLKALKYLPEAEIKTAIDEHKTALTEAAKASGSGGGGSNGRTTPAVPPSRDVGGRTDVTPSNTTAPKDGKELIGVLEQRAQRK